MPCNVLHDVNCNFFLYTDLRGEGVGQTMAPFYPEARIHRFPSTCMVIVWFLSCMRLSGSTAECSICAQRPGAVDCFGFGFGMSVNVNFIAKVGDFFYQKQKKVHWLCSPCSLRIRLLMAGLPEVTFQMSLVAVS